MGGLKALFLASGAVLAATSLAQAADLLPPPPAVEPAPYVPQEFAGWYIRGDVGVAIQTGSINPKVSPNPLIANAIRPTSSRKPNHSRNQPTMLCGSRV